jgi:gp16 family phage-associated protein
MVRTIDEIRAEFKATGVSVSAWARARSYSVPLVYGVLSGRRPATRGQSHNIAVELGLKVGRVGRLEDLAFGRVSSDVIELEPTAGDISEDPEGRARHEQTGNAL